MVISPLQAAEISNCEQDLAQCSEVVEAANKAIKSQGDLIGLQSDQIESLKFDNIVLQQQLKEQQVWYRQPELMIPVSFVLGAISISYARGH